MSACLPIHATRPGGTGRTFLGVACIDLMMEDLVAELTGFEAGENSYSFMLGPQNRYRNTT